MSYQGPVWAAKPSEESWALVEIKSGVQVARHNLSERPWTLLGRDADQAHIALQHESCSRLHARIAFDKSTGIPWLRDLQSSHGTKVNKKPVPTASIGKAESTSTKPGSRGVIIYPADILQFGASSRMYCLEGPEAFSRNKQIGLSNKKTEAIQPSSLPAEGIATQQNDNGAPRKEDDDIVSWGIDMDDHAAEGEDVDGLMKLPADLSEQDIPERLRKDWDSFRAIQYKLEHVQEESDRIRRKGALTDGQERQLAINEERIENLRKDKEAKEISLYRKLYPEKINRARLREEEKSALFDDGEVEDRTREQKGSAIASEEAETEDSLVKKRKALVEDWRKLNGAVRSQAAKCDELTDRIRMMGARGDDETFFVKNDHDMAVDALEKERKKLKDVDIQIDEVDKLLRVVNPKMSLENPSQDDDVLDKDCGFAIPAPVSRPPALEANDFPMPSPVLPAPSTKGTELPLPPTKRRKVQGATMPPPGSSAPSLGTAAITPYMIQASGPSIQQKPKEKPDTTAPANAPDEKHDTWQPPKDQDGSGYTKLNAKFAGRY